MSGHDPAFSLEDSNSLAPGSMLKPYTVTRWLPDEALIPLERGGEEVDAAHALRILHTPGHTPDSIAIYDAEEGRLFVGDTVYPYTPVYLTHGDTSVVELAFSVERLRAFAGAQARPVRVACGHVSDDLDASVALDEFAGLLQRILEGACTPSGVAGDGLVEYRSEQYCIVMPPWPSV